MRRPNVSPDWEGWEEQRRALKPSEKDAFVVVAAAYLDSLDPEAEDRESETLNGSDRWTVAQWREWCEARSIRV